MTIQEIKDLVPDKEFNSAKVCHKRIGRILREANLYHYRSTSHIVIPSHPDIRIAWIRSTKKARVLDLSNDDDRTIFVEIFPLYKG